MKKRNLFLLFIIVLIAFPLWSQGEAEEVKDPEKPYEGVELVWADLQWVFSDSAKKIIPEFEEETGIEIIIENFDPTGLSNRLQMEGVSKSDEFDILYLSPGWIGQVIELDYIMPVDEFLERDNIDLEDDYAQAAIDFVKYPGSDKTWGLPHSAAAMLTVYRKDLFEDPTEKENFKDEYGYELKPPDTMEELLDTAEFFTRDTDGDGHIDFYGYARPHGSVGAAQQTVNALFWTMGTGVFCGNIKNIKDVGCENDFEITINSPENAAALHYFLDLHQYEPEETFSWLTWEQVAFFREGKAAMVPSWYTYVTQLLDPGYSDLADVTWVHPQPNYNQSGGGGIAINRHSNNPEAAWEFIKWLTSKETAIKWMEHGGPIVRKSTHEAPELKEALPDTYEAQLISLDALAEKSTSRITLPEAASINEVLYMLLHDVRDGNVTPEEGLERAEEELKVIFKRAGYL